MSNDDARRGRPAEDSDRRRVAVSDVDDVIGVAEELKAKAADEMSVAEVQSVGRELELSDAVVSRAVDELEKRRRREALEVRARTRAVRRRVTMIAGALGLVLAAMLVAQSSLRGAWTRVEQQRAQMRTVIERQTSVQARYATEAPGASRDAALSGAENRVAIERRRYDQVASDYNRDAQGLPGSLVRGMSGLPARAPLSNEVTSW